MDERTIRQLLQLQEKLQETIANNIAIMDYLDHQTDLLKEQQKILSKIIAQSSFTTADALIMESPSYLKHKDKLNLENVQLIRKIYNENSELLAVLQFQEDHVNIRINKPLETKLTQEKYIEEIVMKTLIPLKSQEPELKTNIKKIEDNMDEYISTINLENIQSYESFEKIENKFRELLGGVSQVD